MKRALFIFFALLSIGGIAFSQTVLDTLTPKDSKDMGMGGAFTTFSTGYSTFFGNPAGFATDKGEFTVADISAWAYFKPTEENIAKIQDLANDDLDDEQMAAFLGDMIVDNGFGAGASVGLGWAGKGFGIGLNMITDEIATGNSLLGSKLVSRNQLNAVLGLGLPIKLGAIRINVGADVRAFYRADSLGEGWPFADIANAAMDDGDPMEIIASQPIAAGYGFAADLGTTAEIGPFMVGVSVRDLGLQFKMDETKDVQDLIDMNIPIEGTTAYKLDPQTGAGVGAKFNVFKILYPSIYAETTDIVGVFEDTDGLWTNLHLGAELGLFKLIYIRAGLNQGYLSAGVGLDLWFFEANAAIFTEEVGLRSGDKGRTGIAANIAIRF